VSPLERFLTHSMRAELADELAGRYIAAWPTAAADVIARYDVQAARLAAGASLTETAWVP